MITEVARNSQQSLFWCTPGFQCAWQAEIAKVPSSNYKWLPGLESN